MNSYQVLKDKQTKEVNEFPFLFAFSNKQLYEGMAKLGLDPTETDKLCSIGSGTYLLKTDRLKLQEMVDRHKREMREAIESDTTGEDFIYDMFAYELSNHEYGVTYDISDTLDACGIKGAELRNNPILRHGLDLAKKKYWDETVC